MSRLDLLRRVPLFQSLDAEDLSKIAHAVREESFEAGHKIVEIGETGHTLYILVDGCVQVLYPARSKDFELARLDRGDFFGEMALLNEKPRSATVKALDPVTALALDKADFRKIVEDSPAVAFKLLEAMSVRIRHADEQISGLSDDATRDPLTGLLNRRAFNERFQEEIARSSRYGDEFTVILIDLDNFTSVNDSFGHETGDEVLSWVGRILSEHTRSADTPFRTGGEEFSILAPATNAETAPHVAERLVHTVAEAKAPTDFDLTVTISAGFASCPEHATRSDTLLSLADQALGRAKKDGRNRVCKPIPLARGPY